MFFSLKGPFWNSFSRSLELGFKYLRSDLQHILLELRGFLPQPPIYSVVTRLLWITIENSFRSGYYYLVYVAVFEPLSNNLKETDYTYRVYRCPYSLLLTKPAATLLVHRSPVRKRQNQNRSNIPSPSLFDNPRATYIILYRRCCHYRYSETSRSESTGGDSQFSSFRLLFIFAPVI